MTQAEFHRFTREQPEKARARLLKVFRESGASRAEAARKMQVNQFAFYRWVADLGLREAFKLIEQEARAAGWKRHAGGRPPGRLDVNPRTEAGNLRQLALSDPDVARRKLLSAYRDSGGSYDRAADILGVSRSTYMKLLRALGLQRVGPGLAKKTG